MTDDPKVTKASSLTLNNPVVMGLSVLVLGTIIGVTSLSLSVFLEYVQIFVLGAHESTAQSATSAEPIRRVISIVVASIIAALVWWVLRRKQAIVSVKKALQGHDMPVLGTIAHALTQVFIVGAGMSIGRETAPREVASMIGQKLGVLLHFSEDDIVKIIAISSGAGFAAVYDSPLAGMFFAVEILLVDVSVKTVIFAWGTSAWAAFIAGLVRGHKPFYIVGEVHITWQLMVACLIIGLACGVVGALFRRTTQWAVHHRVTSRAILWVLPSAGVFTAVVAYLSPLVMGNGRALAQFAYNANNLQAIAFMLVMMCAKWVCTVFTLKSGAFGGVITPALSIGAVLGACIGLVWVGIFPAESVSVMALIASAAVLASTQRAPLMASCLLVELTHSSMMIVIPLGMAVSIACLVSQQVDDAIPEGMLANGLISHRR